MSVSGHQELDQTAEEMEELETGTETINKEQALSSLTQQQEGVDKATQDQRLTNRPHAPTEKKLALQQEEVQKKERKFRTVYQSWKETVRNARQQLKSDLSTAELANLMDTVENLKDDVINLYSEIRQLNTPSPEIRRRVDSCEAVMVDVAKIFHERIAGIDEFDAGMEKRRLRKLLDRDYTHSIFGSDISELSQIHSQHSIVAVVVF